MANKKRTTRTTITRTTTVGNAKRQAPRKGGHGKVIAGIIIVLLIVGVAAYILMNPVLTPQQEQAQFAGQLSTLQSSNLNLTQLYAADAPNYQQPLNRSWSIQVTDYDQANNVTIGQVTFSWSGQSKQLTIQNGIVNTGISPTYAVTLTPNEFEQFTQAVITRNTAAALAYYSEYYLTGSLHYTRVN
jgi:predicted PurR-regulated permease PerM